MKLKDRVKRKLRIQAAAEALAVKLEECAEQNGRSVNAEIVQTTTGKPRGLQPLTQRPSANPVDPTRLQPDTLAVRNSRRRL
jgi:hypothetical protein